MHKLSSVLAACCLAILGSSCGTDHPDRDGIARGPAPYGALFSGDEALKVVFDQVCVPTVLDGGDFVTLAKSHYLIPVAPAKDSTGQSSQTLTIGHANATLWQDATCTIDVERGDSQAYAEHIVQTLQARGQTLRPGVSDKAAGDGLRSTYCNADPRPLILVLIKPASPQSKRPAIVANVFRAKGAASDICLR